MYFSLTWCFRTYLWEDFNRDEFPVQNFVLLQPSCLSLCFLVSFSPSVLHSLMFSYILLLSCYILFYSPILLYFMSFPIFPDFVWLFCVCTSSIFLFIYFPLLPSALPLLLSFLCLFLSCQKNYTCSLFTSLPVHQSLQQYCSLSYVSQRQ
jgi:hypothetical protein